MVSVDEEALDVGCESGTVEFGQGIDVNHSSYLDKLVRREYQCKRYSIRRSE